MNWIQNSFFGNQNDQNTNGQPNRQQQDPSMRGGLPKVIDMLRAAPSFMYDRPDLEKGNKVLLPSEVLQTLTNQYHGGMPHPMVFSISSLRTRKTVYAGVLEFVAPEHTVILPFWLFQELQLREGEMIRLGIADFLPKANFVKIRPHKTEFIELPDPRAVLEIHLRNFVCLSKDESIVINFNGKDYYLDILELKPENQYNTGIIIDTDLNLDFAPPLDYVEPVKKEKKKIIKSGKFQGDGMRIDGRNYQDQRDVEEDNDVYDPRQHKIPHGIRNEWIKTSQKFIGEHSKIGQFNQSQIYNQNYEFQFC